MTTLQPPDEVAPATTLKKKKEPPKNLVIPPPRPQMSKAERRALQEQQRAAKAATTTSQGSSTTTPPSKATMPSDTVTRTDPTTTMPKSLSAPESEKMDNRSSTSAAPSIRKVNDSSVAVAPTRVGLVPHLSTYKDPNITYDTGAVLRHVITLPPSETLIHSPNVVVGASNTSVLTGLHPAVIELGYRYGIGAILGGNARCRAMLECYSTVLVDFASSVDANDTTNEAVTSTDWRSAIENTILKPTFTYWTEYCRPHSVSMGNAFTFLKTAVHSLDRDLTLTEIVQLLIETIDAYIRERIEYAIAAIAETTCTKLLFRRYQNIDSRPKPEVILTYGHFGAVAAVLSRAISSGTKNLRIIIVDSPPLLEGRILLQTLQRQAANVAASENGRDMLSDHVEFSYVHLHAITYVLPNVTKVLLGAAALQSDGSVTGRVGTAVVALAARACNVPVLVCAETHKISNRGVPLESLTHNELRSGWSNNNIHADKIRNSSSSGEPKRLDLLYDSTPASFVSGIVTEFGIIPPSSIAVLIREMNQTQSDVKL
jgi:translation initiation factor eIF-2B subunit delta